MIRSRLGLKALGLCALVLGLMAISAGAAQAEKGAHWNVNGNAVTNALKAEIGATLEGSHGILLSRAIGVAFQILCTGMTFEEALLLEEGGSSGKIKFTGCKTLLGEKEEKNPPKESKPCEPHTGTEESGKGVIVTTALKDLIVLHEGKPVDQLEPATGETFVTVQTSPECSVGGKAGIPVIGKFTFKDSQGEGTVEKVTHLAQELTALTKLWILSKTIEHESTIDGSAEAALVGAHNGLKWSGIPA